MRLISGLNPAVVVFVGLLSMCQPAFAALCWSNNGNGTKTCKESDSLACTSSNDARCTTEGDTVPASVLGPVDVRGDSGNKAKLPRTNTAVSNGDKTKAEVIASKNRVNACGSVVVSKNTVTQNNAKELIQRTHFGDNVGVLSFLNQSVKKIALMSCGGGGGVKRVKVCVTGHWPLNRCYEFGSDALRCSDLLGEGESFPDGVTCENR